MCTGRCRCKKNQVQCSIYCHADEHDCGNLSPLSTRIEIALVDCSLNSLGHRGRKRTSTVVGGQSTGRIMRGREAVVSDR
jgi:hypothetical protein